MYASPRSNNAHQRDWPSPESLGSISRELDLDAEPLRVIIQAAPKANTGRDIDSPGIFNTILHSIMGGEPLGVQRLARLQPPHPRSEELDGGSSLNDAHEHRYE